MDASALENECCESFIMETYSMQVKTKTKKLNGFMVLWVYCNAWTMKWLCLLISGDLCCLKKMALLHIEKIWNTSFWRKVTLNVQLGKTFPPLTDLTWRGWRWWAAYSSFGAWHRSLAPCVPKSESDSFSNTFWKWNTAGRLKLWVDKQQAVQPDDITAVPK